ncbi:hypothetical protein C8F01DRAFT_1226133 [Mycena amicta]|nr:hypothetical protein C8F01DRAFT_1226133 [Mycena amicta]
MSHDARPPTRRAATSSNRPTHSPQRNPQGPPLSRHGSLLSPGTPSTLRRAAELRTLLGNSSTSRLPPRAAVSHRQGQETTSLEQAKPRARVELDITLRNNICVEGGFISGLIKLRIRSSKSKLAIGDAKLRLIGLETAEGDHHEFFQHSAALSEIGANVNFKDSPLDSEGFFQAQEGVHRLNFCMRIPMNEVEGSRPRGVFRGQSGVAVRYIALVPSIILTPAEQPLQAAASPNLGKGNITLKVGVHRKCFVAGTSVPVTLNVHNGSKRLIKSVTLTLYRTTTIFKRKLEGDTADMHVCQASAPKSIASSTLEIAQGYPRGHASASGWWSGIPAGEDVDFSHFCSSRFVLVTFASCTNPLSFCQSDALTYPRGRLIEVGYTLKASLSCGPLTPDVSVTLPIRILNFFSLDPPPSVAAPPLEDVFRSDDSLVAPSGDLSISAISDDAVETCETDSASCYPTEEDADACEDSDIPDVVEDLVRRSIFAGQAHGDSKCSATRSQAPDIESENLEPTDTGDHSGGIPNKRRCGPSSFAQRVQMKLQHARQPLLPDNSSSSASPLLQASSTIDIWTSHRR